MIGINSIKYDKRFPKTDIVNTKDISARSQAHYFKIYCTYNNLFLKYLNRTLGLRKYDNVFKNDELGFKSLSYTVRDFYQQISFYKFFYVRNNFHLEKLTESEVHFFSEKVYNNDIELDKKTEIIISNNYKTIIDESLNEENKLLCFGSKDKKYMLPTDSLKLGIRFDENVPNVEEQFKRANELALEFSKEFSEKLGIRVDVIVYDKNAVVLENE